jgi:hypothetical protein
MFIALISLTATKYEMKPNTTIDTTHPINTPIQEMADCEDVLIDVQGFDNLVIIENYFNTNK